MDVAKLRVVIDGDASGAERALASTSKSVQDAGKKMAMAGGVMTAGITAPIAGIGFAAFNAASDLEESMSKVNVVFGSAAGSIVAFSETAAEALGMSQQQALEATGTFGNLMSAMGIATPRAADMSKQFVTLAADLASFNNASPEETLLALRAGLTGETEPLKRFGVNLNQARIEAEALRLGLAKAPVDMRKVEMATNSLTSAQADLSKMQKDGTASAEEIQKAQDKVTRAEIALEKAMGGSKVELDAAMKAQAAYSLIMADTTLAQGDFARTADGAANQQRILSAQLKDTAASIGQELLPVGLKLLGFVRDVLDRFNDLSPSVKQVIIVVGGLAAAIGPILTIVGGLTTAIGFLASPIGLIVAGIAVLAAGFVILYKRSEKFREVVAKAWESIKGVISKAGELISTVMQKVRDWMDKNQGTVTSLKERFESAFSAIGNAVSSVADFIGTVLTWISAFWQEWGDEIMNVVANTFGGILRTIEGVFKIIQGVFQVFSGILTGDFSKMTEGIKAIFSGMWDTIAGMFQRFTAPIRQLATSIGNAIKDPIVDAFNSVVSFFTTLPGKLAAAAVGMWDGIKNAFRGAINWIVDKWNSFELQLPSFAGLKIAGQTVIPGWEGPTLPMPKLDRLAMGGLVTSPTVAMIGERGDEAVIPLTRDNPTLNALAAALAREIAVAPAASATGAGGITINTDITVNGSGVNAADLRSQLVPLLDERDATLLRAIRAR